jgi:hypothetical protein
MLWSLGNSGALPHPSTQPHEIRLSGLVARRPKPTFTVNKSVYVRHCMLLSNLLRQRAIIMQCHGGNFKRRMHDVIAFRAFGTPFPTFLYR